MNFRLLRIVPVLLGALLVGCASSGSLSRDSASKLTRVGVISVAATNFSRQYVGVTVFGNEREQVDISSWGMNAEYEKQLGAAIDQVFKAKAVYAPYSFADFSRLHELSGPWNAPAFWAPNWGAIEEATRKYCAATGVDAIAIAGRVKMNDIFAGTNQHVEGVGIYARRGTHVLHALVVVGLLDCKTAKPLAIARLTTASSEYRTAYPVMQLPEELARKKRSEWTHEDEQKLKQMATLLPRQAWVETLTKMLTER